MCWLPAPSEAPHHALVALLLSASEDALRSPGTSPAPVTDCAGTLPASLSCGMVFRNQEGVCAPLLGCHCFQTLSVHRARGKNPQVHIDTSNSNPRSQSAPVASQATLGSCCLPSPSVLLSRARLFATPWTAARRAPLSVGVSRQEHSVGCLSSSRGSSRPRDRTRISHMAGRFFATAANWAALLLTLAPSDKASLSHTT